MNHKLKWTKVSWEQNETSCVQDKGLVFKSWRWINSKQWYPKVPRVAYTSNICWWKNFPVVLGCSLKLNSNPSSPGPTGPGATQEFFCPHRPHRTSLRWEMSRVYLPLRSEASFQSKPFKSGTYRTLLVKSKRIYVFFKQETWNLFIFSFKKSEISLNVCCWIFSSPQGADCQHVFHALCGCCSIIKTFWLLRKPLGRPSKTTLRIFSVKGVPLPP